MNALEQLKVLVLAVNERTPLADDTDIVALLSEQDAARHDYIGQHGPALVELIEAAGAMQAAPSFPVGGSADRFRTALSALTQEATK